MTEGYKVHINVVLKEPVDWAVSFEFPEIKQIHLIHVVLQYSKCQEEMYNERYFFDY